MNAEQMLKALKALDRELPEPVKLLIGGGAAFILAHHIPLSTMDIDGIPFKSRLQPADLDSRIKKVAKFLGLPPDWLNTYFAAFTYSLPKDYGERLVSVLKGKKLEVWALGKEDLLIMKCFAGREKDIPHARLLLKKNVDVKRVEQHLNQCIDENLPNARQAADFFYDICEQTGTDI